MKSEQVQTAVIVVAAMLLGSGLTYFLVRDKTPAPVRPGAEFPREATTSITPPPGRLETQVRRQNEALDDAQFEAAVSRARADRKAGKLKPLATTPDEFAAALGALNFRIHEYSVRYATPPADGSPQAAAADREMQQLIEELANLFSDDDLLAKLNESTPADLARAQSHLAAGALGLDTAATAKVAEIINKTYAEALPPELAGRQLTAEQEAEFDRKLEALNEKMAAQILELLTPAQRARFEALGADQVLFGLHGDE
jgi:hypothetical protein